MKNKMSETWDLMKVQYSFTKVDENLLMQMQPHLESHVVDFLDGFYESIWKLGNVSEFFEDDRAFNQHRDIIRQWYLDLFAGIYETDYFSSLEKIREAHAKLAIPTHHMMALFYFTPTFTINIIQKHNFDDNFLSKRIKAIEKIMAINLDILTGSFREIETSQSSSTSKLEIKLLRYLHVIGAYFNYLLMGALVMVATFAIGLFGYDVFLLFSGNTSIEKGILTTLGSLLILWAAIELINEEIKHLSIGSSALAAFITLAIAALIRKILIVSLSPDKTNEILMYGLLVLFLSVSYWLISLTLNPQKLQGK